MQDSELESWAVIPDAPAEIGPDYVALVIEWEDPLDLQDTQVTPRPANPHAGHPLRKVAVAVGALALLFVGRTVVRRLRHA